MKNSDWKKSKGPGEIKWRKPINIMSLNFFQSKLIPSHKKESMYIYKIIGKLKITKKDMIYFDL